ncbi:O-antigen ligase family protein [Pseudonocardia cypriaca]|uniref:O-antigen ligase n=1 Tax=Pseudonocardia cypriaca TaxID=882449 RepID=A0A543GAI0_9PSEU|nr:O-antigen ligase family protein [Pseudonocardia cypriaca]TQM43082.1 O-antigen ligase [Pseudonocardia cypriaca]
MADATTLTGTARRGVATVRAHAAAIVAAPAFPLHAGVGAGVLVIVAVVFAGPVSGPSGLLFVAAALAMAALVLGSPTAAMLVLLVASFTRLAVEVPALPSEPMVFALLALMIVAGVAVFRGTMRFRIGAIEAAMALYLLWNLVSTVWPHDLPPVEPGTGAVVPVLRFIMTGTLMPFLAFVVARVAFRTERTIRPVLFLITVLAAYSAAVSIVQFTGPTALVWPHYILESRTWEGRAVGIFNQPVVNGLTMIAGFVTGMFLARERSLRPAARIAGLVVAAMCVPGIYLTHTRAVWLVFGLAVVLCAVFAAGARAGFVVTLGGAVAFIALTWTTFTSSDRAAGGIGSTSEVDDRLNAIATALWAIEQKPILGWGIARFAALNTYHHQVWAPNVDFRRGYAIASHENELGIAAELGVVGLVLWLAVLIGVIWKLLSVLRRMPVEGLAGRRLGLLALTVVGTWVVCGLTVDLRYFDFANLLVFLLVGAAIGAAESVRAEPDRAPVAVR